MSRDRDEEFEAQEDLKDRRAERKAKEDAKIHPDKFHWTDNDITFQKVKNEDEDEES